MRKLLTLFLLPLNLLFSASESHSLILLPEERQYGITSSDPFISMLDRAQNEILMASYKLQEKKLPQKDLLDALSRATSRGVTVHLIAENRLTKEEVLTVDGVKKGDSLKAYLERGVQVHFPKGDFNQSHTKIIIIDQNEAIIGNTNFDKEPEGIRAQQPPSRDFAIQTKDLSLINELTRGFWSDVQGVGLETTSQNLIWGPEGQRKRFYDLIRGAKASIRIYQQDMTDKGILHELLDALQRGIKVELIMSPHPFGLHNKDNNIPNQQILAESGAEVYLTQEVSIHAKVMLIDSEILYVGSTNFYQSSIDQNRNVGLLTKDGPLIEQVLQIVEKDKNDGRSPYPSAP